MSERLLPMILGVIVSLKDAKYALHHPSNAISNLGQWTRFGTT